MDVRTAVAASMLPASRAVVAAAFRELRHDDAAHGPASGFLELLWSVCRRGESAAPIGGFRAHRGGGRRRGNRRSSGNRRGSAVRRAISALLACIHDPPPVLGSEGDFRDPRLASGRGDRLARATLTLSRLGTRIAAELAERGIVVSGLARGVDSAAHRGCLEGRVRPRPCWAAASIGSIHRSMPIWRLR